MVNTVVRLEEVTMISETKFTIRLYRILGGRYKISVDEYRNSTSPINTNVLGLWLSWSKAIEMYNKAVSNISKDLFTVTATYKYEASSFYQTDYKMNDLTDVDMFFKGNKL